MSRLHSTLLALVLGAAAIAGLFAAVQTVRLGQKTSAQTSTRAAARDLAFRQARLTRWSRSLQEARAKRPPALPKIPKFAPVESPPATASPVAQTAPTAPPKVTYARRQTVVEYRHATGSPSTATTSAAWSDDGGQSDDGGSSDDGSPSGGD